MEMFIKRPAAVGALLIAAQSVLFAPFCAVSAQARTPQQHAKCPPKHKHKSSQTPSRKAGRGPRAVMVRRPGKGVVMTPRHGTAAAKQIRFDLANDPVVVTEHDLNTIRQAVLAYLRTSDEDLRDTLIAELETAPAFIDEAGTGRVGVWLLQQRGDALRLVHHPERAPVMYLHYAVLERRSASWRVQRFGVERVRAR